MAQENASFLQGKIRKVAALMYGWTPECLNVNGVPDCPIFKLVLHMFLFHQLKKCTRTRTEIDRSFKTDSKIVRSD